MQVFFRSFKGKRILRHGGKWKAGIKYKALFTFTKVNTDLNNKIDCIKDGGLQETYPIWPSVLHLILEHIKTITTYRAKQESGNSTSL